MGIAKFYNFTYFHAVVWKKWSNSRLVPPLGVVASSEKSWIRHCGWKSLANHCCIWGVAILTGVQCRQKCLFGCTWLIQSRLIEVGTRGHAVLVRTKNWIRVSKLIDRFLQTKKQGASLATQFCINIKLNFTCVPGQIFIMSDANVSINILD